MLGSCRMNSLLASQHGTGAQAQGRRVPCGCSMPPLPIAQAPQALQDALACEKLSALRVGRPADLSGTREGVCRGLQVVASILEVQQERIPPDMELVHLRNSAPMVGSARSIAVVEGAEEDHVDVQGWPRVHMW